MSTLDNFTQTLQNNAPIPQLKQALTNLHDKLKQDFDPSRPAGPVLREKSLFIDQLLSACWRHFLQNQAHQHCLIATGGYGRNELFLHSDIDICILLDDETNEPPSQQLQEQLSAFSNFLWDIGLKPGLSIRNLNESIEQSRADQTILTNLMEIRLLSGNENLFEKLRSQLFTKDIWSSEQFFHAKLEEQEQRHEKFHGTAYNLEPNIKEGPGGLRDLHIIAWVFKHHYKSETLKELIKYGFMPESEYQDLIQARNKLWRLRFALHKLTNRCEDRLLFDHQRDLAIQFGFTTEDQGPDVESFMQFYFNTAAQIQRINEILLQLFDERFIEANNQQSSIPITKNFSSVNGYLEVSHENVFNDQPLTLLEIFLLLQQSPAFKGIRATTIRLIRKSLHLIDDAFRSNPKANQLFMEILRQPKSITKQLRAMNRYGILAAYLPAFANIVSRMQYDLFHIYTVDAHTLFVIRNLRRFSLEKHNHELPFCNTIFLLINRPDVLYITALFHDIAKGMGGNHSVLGEGIAIEFCKQHKISEHYTKLIAWLVRNHLLMSQTAQKKDLSDPAVIHDFALKVGSTEHLNYLYLLTVADIRATNPNIWNSWKDTLLKELYTATHTALHRGLHNPIRRSERLISNKKESSIELLNLGITQPTIDRCWQSLISDDYLLRYSPEEIAWHTIAIAGCTEDELPLVLLRPQNQRGSAEIFIYTKNQPTIFASCAATLDALNLTILDARINTSEENYAINSFQILEQSGEPITDLFREARICTTLREKLINTDQKPATSDRKKSRQARHFPIKTRVSFLDDPLKKHTILELITTDRAGILAIVGRAFIEKNIQLHNAKITTIGSRVEDMFYITDERANPITDSDRLSSLRNRLMELLKE